MRKLLIIALTLLTSSLYAQQGIQFYEGTWKETLAKAKAENKLIFIDIYTSWCGPCKMMAKDIFPLESVGEVFNKNFINFKIDAEKGEGIQIAKTYKVNAYPSYLFVSGDGVLYYTSLGAMPEANFLQEADNALTEFGDPKPLPVWQEEYASGKNDKVFLMGYMKKRSKLRLSADSLIDQYAALAAKEELLSKDTLTYLLQQTGAKVDGPFFTFLTSNKAEVAKTLGQPEGFVNGILSRYAAGDLKRAVALNDVKLMEKIAATRLALSSDTTAKLDVYQMRVSFYAQTHREQELIKALDQYSKGLLAYDRNSIKEADSTQLQNFEESLKTGSMKDLTPQQIEQARKFAGSMAATNYAYRVRDMAGAAYRNVDDKKTLNQALKWMAVAAEFSDNFTIAEMTAGLLHKLGRTTEAIGNQQKAIQQFTEVNAAMNLVNEVISKRLKDGLQKMTENKPTWIEDTTPTLATK